jgi:hypothetical protein
VRFKVSIPVQLSTCRSCDAEIVWAETPTGKKLPLSWRSREGIYDDCKLVAWTMTAHFADCPHANVHRAKREPKPKQRDLFRN